MTKKLTDKLRSHITLATSQKEAVISFMSRGNTITAHGAWNAGIGDPRMVINLLRKDGYDIKRDEVTNRGRTSIVYSLMH